MTSASPYFEKFAMPRSDQARIGDIVPNLPWVEMAGIRDVVVHQYFGIEVKTVWNAATVSVPNVLKVLMSALS